jgi:predicted DNA-binding transcriptional regulator AlpA
MTDTMQDATDHILKTMMARRGVKSSTLGAPIAPVAPIALKPTKIQAQDNGHQYMTVHDLACKLQKDEAFVRGLTKARAQRQSKFPVPFFKINGRALRFDRKKIEEWLQNMANDAPVLKPVKAKRGRPRKTN